MRNLGLRWVRWDVVGRRTWSALKPKVNRLDQHLGLIVGPTRLSESTDLVGALSLIFNPTRLSGSIDLIDA